VEREHEADLVQRREVDGVRREQEQLAALEPERREPVTLGDAPGEEAPRARVGIDRLRRRRRQARGAAEEPHQLVLADRAVLEQRRVEGSAGLALTSQRALELLGGGRARFDEEGGEIERHVGGF